MQKDNTNRKPDYDTREFKNVAWTLLGRRQSSGCNMAIIAQRFEPGGDFERHTHDMEQFFYVTKGAVEMTIGGETEVFREGDFIVVERNVEHEGRNVAEGESELIAVDYWPADSDDRIGLD